MTTARDRMLASHRAISPRRIEVLDHGYVELVETWGSDEDIIRAARMSTQKGFLRWEPGDCPLCIVGDFPFKEGPDPHCIGCGGKGKVEGDAKLLKRLHLLNHATPFEMAGACFEVSAPIIVFREWHRHRTQSYNEASARYSPLPAIDYRPTLERMMVGVNPTANKQAGTVSDADLLTEEFAISWLDDLDTLREAVEKHYQKGLKGGVPKELARLSMTVGRYSSMRAQAVLRNWMGFLVLRDDKAAQAEIREYAKAVAVILRELFPRSMELHDEKVQLWAEFMQWVRERPVAGSGG